ncbi:uncharacterized protein LOC26536376 [Drosophila yakuba]|uniref:Uncharacterized protein n=1 Tax=Drosophila yakuba TaxID=7245 RepID=A0A0R1E9W8_DROYA|nr:uncharacterized protein LOC26536376 [Drosophila yakuba]KRK06198.1 uncharacterized protein Dyak_GE29195 [Drosophila yakuba]
MYYSANRRSQSAHPPSSSRAARNPDAASLAATFLDKNSRPNFRVIRTVIPLELPSFVQAPALITMLKSQIARRKQFLESSNALGEDLLKRVGGRRDAVFFMHSNAMGELKQAISELAGLLHQLELVYDPVAYGKVSVRAQQADKRAQMSENLLHGRNEQLERHVDHARTTGFRERTNDARRRLAEKDEASRALGVWRSY